MPSADQGLCIVEEEGKASDLFLGDGGAERRTCPRRIEGGSRFRIEEGNLVVSKGVPPSSRKEQPRRIEGVPAF